MQTSTNLSASAWSIIFWLFGTVVLPVTIPWMIYRVLQYNKARQRLHGKVVLITGASSGLGEALAHVFYRLGCKVILASRNMEHLERVKADLLAAHTVTETFNPEIVQLDLSDLKALPGHIKTALDIHGHIDILINNGGISYRGNILDTAIETDMRLMMVNYFGQICVTKAVLPSMIMRKQGHIVAISSVQGRIAIPHRSAYTASKHALQAFCDSLRAEVADHGIKVMVVSPGYIKTNLSINALTGCGEKYGVLDKTTATGLASEEVAQKVLSGVLREQKEVVISPLSPWLAIYLRTFCPSLYFFIMEKRASKPD